MCRGRGALGRGGLDRVGWGGWGRGAWGSSCVFKLSFRSETRLLSFTSSQENLPLPPVWCIYHSKGSSYSLLWVQNEGMRVGHQGPKWTSAYQFSTSALAFNLTPRRHRVQVFFLYIKHKPVGYKYTAIHPVGELRFIFGHWDALSVDLSVLRLCNNSAVLVVKASTTGKLQLNSKLLLVLHHVLLQVPLLVLQVFLILFYFSVCSIIVCFFILFFYKWSHFIDGWDVSR